MYVVILPALPPPTEQPVWHQLSAVFVFVFVLCCVETTLRSCNRPPHDDSWIYDRLTAQSAVFLWHAVGG